MTRFLPLYIPVFSATLLLSAFLLFGIQPLFGKMILPMLGGAPAVWNTAMVFFQAMLLAGYAYAHLTTRLMGVRAQAVLHILVLLSCAVFLPVSIPLGWRDPPAVSNPAFWQIGMMTVAIGGPFFVLAGTAPMLQRWFSLSPHPDSHNPYFLYAASNLGSMLALLLYPFVVEPLLKLKIQSIGWSVGYGFLILLTAACAFLPRQAENKKETAKSAPANDNALTPARIGLWLLLTFIPSSLMLGVTTYITTDLASVPLLWILPLALYVGTFIIAFARAQPVTLKKVLEWQSTFLLLVITSWIIGWQFNKALVVVVHLVLFFLTALFCHMQLAAARPDARNLTAFYLIMSLGGVLGGIFNALIAPQIFTLPIEYALILALSGFLRYQTDKMQSFAALKCFFKGAGKDTLAHTKIPVMVILAAIALSLFTSRALASFGG
ncbi:MAG: spermidine synthase, partial [Proteobacteria bacterium]|nr:spermidine synthase [Pseudomonadota bacterium]